MIHACFMTVATCFPYITKHFYAFCGNNILTRCQSASSYFLLFFGFRKVVLKIFSELDETKTQGSIFLTRTRSPKETRKGPRRQAHHVAAPPLCRTMAWCGPLGRPSTSPFRLYICFIGKPLNTRASIHDKFRSHRRR